MTNAQIFTTLGGPFEFDNFADLNNHQAWNWVCITGNPGAFIRVDGPAGTRFIANDGAVTENDNPQLGPSIMLQLQSTVLMDQGQYIGIEYCRIAYPYPMKSTGNSRTLQAEQQALISATDMIQGQSLKPAVTTFDLIMDGGAPEDGPIIGYLSTTDALALADGYGNGHGTERVANSIYVFVDPNSSNTYVTATFQGQTSATIVGYKQGDHIPLANGFARINIVDTVEEEVRVNVSTQDGAVLSTIKMSFTKPTLGSSSRESAL